MKRIFLSFLHDDIWEVNQFRAMIGNEYVGAMAYDESLKDPVKSLSVGYIQSKLSDMINRASMAILLVSDNSWKDPNGWLEWEMTKAWDMGKKIGAMKFKNAAYASDPVFLSKFKILAAQWNIDTIRNWMADEEA
ncbi:MAG: TIR domain-containing protein [Candidatus Aminicenantes bacterium]|nr:TIR domain-containing protein [Candidatus Aminicenantes bacterium]